MRALIVNNSNITATLLSETFSNYEVTILPWNELKNVDMNIFDFVVLSGSSNFPIVGNESQFLKEMEIIRTSTKPILGICYGFELVVVAFGGTLRMMDRKERGVTTMEIITPDPIFEGIERLFVYEGHHWKAESLPEVLVPLAKSPHGIEAVKHRNKPIYGFQFHPEKLERETEGGRIIQNFLSLV